MTAKAPNELPFTGDDEADALLASDPMALLIGFVLDQQVTVQKAFSGPLELIRRIGTLDAVAIAAMDPVDLEKRLMALPGIGDMKAKALLAILGRRFGVELDGLAEVMPDYPTLADVDSADALAEYQEKKRAYKAKLKAEGGSFDPNDIGTPKRS